MNMLQLRTAIVLVTMSIVGCEHQKQIEYSRITTGSDIVRNSATQIAVSSATSSPGEETQISDIERFLQVVLVEDSTVVVWRSKGNDKQKLEQTDKQELARLLRLFVLQKWHSRQLGPDDIIFLWEPIPDFYIKVYHPAEGSEEAVYFAQVLVFFPERGQRGPPLVLTFFPDQLTVGYDLFTQQIHEFTSWLKMIKHEAKE